MASLASPAVPSHGPATAAGFLPAPTSRSRGPPRLLSPSPPSASALFSSASARFHHTPRAPCSAARQRRRDTVRACSQAGAAGPAPLLKTLADLKDSCWRFLRPHTIRGTALGSTALVARALIENPQLIDWRLVFKAFYGLVGLICGNGYIVGINQIYDIGIDKVNKAIFTHCCRRSLSSVSMVLGRSIRSGSTGAILRDYEGKFVAASSSFLPIFLQRLQRKPMPREKGSS